MPISGNAALDAGMAAGGMAANYFTGKSANKASKEAMRAQTGLLKQQARTYKAAQPTYQAALQQYAQAAGLDPNQHDMRRPGGMGSQWGQPEDQYRFAAAQDQMNHLAQQRQNQLQHTMAQRGIATSSQGAALAHNQRAALQDLAGFRRQLAIDAPHEAERRRAALLNALGPAFGQGAQASQGFGQQGAQYGNEANQAWASMGNIAQNWQQQQSLNHFSKLYGTDLSGGGGGYDYAYLDNPVTYGTSPGYGPNVVQGPAATNVNPNSYNDWLAKQFAQYG